MANQTARTLIAAIAAATWIYFQLTDRADRQERRDRDDRMVTVVCRGDSRPELCAAGVTLRLGQGPAAVQEQP